MAFVYTPRAPTAGVLYEVVRGHLTAFLATVAARTDGAGLPTFVTKEFRKFLGCGVLSRGFARLRCGTCAFERLIPFSCKGRAFCPSCGGRRMTERAAHLVDHVFPPDVPAGDRSQLERLCCYVFRPPLGQHRLRRLGDGRIAVELQRKWADGTTHLVFTPAELLERLATLVPRPRINLLLYHGSGTERALAPYRGAPAGGRGARRRTVCPRRERPRGGHRDARSASARPAEVSSVGRLDAPGVRRGRARMSALRGADGPARNDRRRGGHHPDPDPPGAVESGEPDPAHPPPEIDGDARA